MLRPRGLSAELYLAQLPLLAGASETLAKGLTSSLAPQNHSTEAFIDAPPNQRHKPQYEILFDPQTSGGLLAAIAPEKVSGCLRALHHADYTNSTEVGRILPDLTTESRLLISL